MDENEISKKIIGAAIEVHRILGPNLLESIYEEALCHELVEEKLIVDLKAKEFVTAIDRQKLLSYLRLSKKKLGLIINFHVAILKDGVERIVNGLKE